MGSPGACTTCHVVARWPSARGVAPATTDVATKVSGNTYKAVYTVTVTNIGDGPGSYTLNDLPDFGSGANVVGEPEFDPAITGPVGLNAGDSDVYTVTVTFTVDGSMPGSERECFTQPTPGAGAYNGVTVNFNDGGSDHSADCIDIPEPDISRDKIVDPEQPLTRNADGSWTVGYVLTVERFVVDGDLQRLETRGVDSGADVAAHHVEYALDRHARSVRP